MFKLSAGKVSKKMTIKFFLYTILLLGFISTQCLIDMIPITDTD
jgi:hypothetical protein